MSCVSPVVTHINCLEKLICINVLSIYCNYTFKHTFNSIVIAERQCDVIMTIMPFSFAFALPQHTVFHFHFSHCISSCNCTDTPFRSI